MAGFDYRTKPETANELSFYLFDNLKMQESGEGGNVYRFDTMKEAIVAFRMIRSEHPNWTTALGGSVGGGHEIDFVHVREGGVTVLIDDFQHIDFWRNRADVAQAIEEFAAGPGIEWQTDREFLGGPILVPYAPESLSDDPYLADKALMPSNPSNAFTGVVEAYVEGHGWVKAESLRRLASENRRNPDDYLRVSHLNVAYETTGAGSEEQGRTGYVDITPSEIDGMMDRFRELMDAREPEQESPLPSERQPNQLEPDLPESDMGRPFFDYATSYGETEKVNLELANYADNDNLYVGMNYFDRDLGAMDFYGDVTVNIVQLPPFMAAIDTNNNDAEKIMSFLTQNGFGEPTGGALPSGFCMYPVFQFSEERLREVDPRGFEQYCKTAGIKLEEPEASKDSLDEAKKQAKARATKRNAEHPEKTSGRSRDLEL